MTGETTLAAGRRLGGDVACLVFASARNPGGGSLGGAQAQEESIARSSALYACQLASARVLRVAAAHGHRGLVLGAWGCGVFRNDPGVVADAFATTLREVDRFDRVVFAIRDGLPGTPVHAAFAARFGRGPSTPGQVVRRVNRVR